jgi:hypothetical protein
MNTLIRSYSLVFISLTRALCERHREGGAICTLGNVEDGHSRVALTWWIKHC